MFKYQGQWNMLPFSVCLCVGGGGGEQKGPYRRTCRYHGYHQGISTSVIIVDIFFLHATVDMTVDMLI